MKSKNDKETILTLKPFTDRAYKNFDLDRLAVYVLYELSRKKIPLYFDHIAIGMFKLFPLKFSMANFNQYPDTNRIDKTLRRLTDSKSKSWAIGTIENGFGLTDFGKEIARQTFNYLQNPDLQKKRNTKTITKSRGKSLETDLKEIKESETFKKWKDKKLPISTHEIFAFLKAASYTPKHLLVTRIDTLKKMAETLQDNEGKKFLTWIEKEFYNLFY